MLYTSIVVVGSVAIAWLRTLLFQQNFFHSLAYTSLIVLFSFLVCGITAGAVRLLPKKLFDKENVFFTVGKKEKSLYEKCKIRRWKDKVPDLGKLTGFDKDRVGDVKDAAYLRRFLLECHYGEVGHLLSLFSESVIFLFASSFVGGWLICVCVWLVAAFLNLLPIFVLRYNSYKLNILYKNLIKKERLFPKKP